MPTRAFLVAVIASAIFAVPAFAQSSGRLFSCKVLTTGALTSDGKLAISPLQKQLAKIQTEFVYDEATQILRWEQSDAVWQYKQVQEGSDQNGLVTVRIYDGGASVVVDVMRIRTFQKSWPFLLVEQDEVYTGTCKKF